MAEETLPGADLAPSTDTNLVSDPVAIDPATPEANVDPAADPAAIDPATPEAPADYAEFTVPEGVQVNPEAMAAFKIAAKDMGLTQEQAQGLTDMGAQMAQRITQEHEAKIEQTKSDWEASSRADKEFGGDKLDENLGIAKTALDAFATPELKEILTTTGLGNHPDLIRMMVRIGKAMSEDTLVPGGRSSSSEGKSLAERLYKNQPNTGIK
ncbi:MAG: hypothetical protein WC762_03105 [Methylobacter sp.]|jgi:hypothetical protein